MGRRQSSGPAERVPADRFVHDRASFTARDFAYGFHKVTLIVNDDMIRAGLARRFGLGLGTDCPDDRGAKKTGPLAEDETHSACSGVNQDDITLFDTIGPTEQILRRQSLEHGSRQVTVIKICQRARNLEELPHRVGADLTVGAMGWQGIGDPVADREFRDTGAGLLDDSDAFETKDEGEFRHRPGMRHAAPVVGVDVVDANGSVAKTHFPPGRGVEPRPLPSAARQATLSHGSPPPLMSCRHLRQEFRPRHVS